MQHHLFVVSLLALFALMAFGVPTPVDSLISDDAITDMSSVVQAYPGAPNITLNGTIQEVYAQLLEINPNYDEDWKNEPSEMGTVSDAFNLWAYTLRCSPNNGVTQGPVKEGIEYLRKVRGQPHLGRGPRKCERVSCSWNTGIFWCNDDTTSRSLPSFNNIADGAQVILSHCNHQINELFSGELSHPDKWRAVVQWSDC